MTTANPATADLSDAHPEAQVCAPVFRDYGSKRAFHGPIATVKVFEDNALVRATLETPGEGRVLVVDGGGSLRCALVGGLLGELALKNGWAGIVVNGCVRDTVELAAQDVGVKALAAHPRKSEKGLHSGVAERVVEFAGVCFQPGAWLYADADGIVVADAAIHRG
ncbi:ribonuclease E activity regulator RraA [Rudaea sp.]|uniref:ribonuclease E activity regulator RraA n=1 Tax=Rudaea sp. TaxID=2136325 RepID=UPI002ED0BE5B